MIPALVIAGLFVALAAGIPIGLAMLLVGTLGLYVVGGAPAILGIISSAPLSTITNYELISIPMFVLMAQLLVSSGVADELFETMKIWVGRARGGLAIATVLTGAGFAALSGSSTVSAATLASTSLPAMVTRGYDRRLACGVVAISGTLGMLIPPSLTLIFYSLLADQNIAKMLLSGIVPGIIVTILIVLTVQFLVFRDPSLAPRGTSYSAREKFAAARGVAPTMLIILLVTGSMYFGLATPGEASAIGALGAFCVAAARRGRSVRSFVAAVVSAVRTSAMILMILIGASVYGYALTLTRATQDIVAYIGGLDTDRYVIIALIILLKLVLGFFMDQFAILVLTVPIVVPIVIKLGFDPIWFGIILVLTAEVGMVSPPIGMNAYVITRFTGRPVEEVFSGVMPHIVVHLLAIIVFTMFPQIVTWLPSTM
jgi:tripartite ATP-independent transporter DctM subunit